MAPSPPISRRKFTASPLPSSTAGPVHPRHLKRVHIAAELLKAAKICAGDVVVVRATEEAKGAEDRLVDGVENLELKDKENQGGDDRFAVGIAWPSFTLSGTKLGLSTLVLANAGVALESSVSLCPLGSSGVELVEAESVTLIYDVPSDFRGKGKEKAKDSFFEAYVKEVALDSKYFALKHFIAVTFQGIQRRLLVSSFSPTIPPTSASSTSTAPVAFFVTRSTSFIFLPPRTPPPPPKSTAVSTRHSAETSVTSYATLGGLSTQIAQIRELVEWPLTRPELYKHFGLNPPRGILLHGPPGTGKTLLARSIAHSLSAPIFSIDGPSLSSSFHGETESALRSVFNSARAAAKSSGVAVIVIDEIDALAPNREEAGEVERRVVATLLVEMDGLGGKKVIRGDEEEGEEEVKEEQGRVLVIAATNRPNAVDPALRRPGRFDKEIEIGVPDAASRLSILNVLLAPIPHALTSSDLLFLSSQTHGFVGADLSSLVHTAGLHAIRRAYPLLSSPSPPLLSSLLLTYNDLTTALLSTRPSALREVFLETPKVKWSDIGGMEEVQMRLRECVEWPLTRPEAFTRLGVRPPKGVLLYGPPGCSKTLIAKALATEGGLNFIAVKGPEIFNKYVGESEKAIRELFRKARSAAPSIVFLDEVDALAPARGSDDGGATSDRVLLSLLTEMDGIEELNGVVVLAATNRPDVIDPALMRPGRLDRILYVSPPDIAARRQIFTINLGKMAVGPDLDVDELAELTDGCSGAELVSICQDAALAAMNESLDVPYVSRPHFVAAARGVRRRITREMVLGYEQWRDSSGLRSA